MAENRIALDVAAFLDSPEARSLEAPGAAGLRKIAEAFIGICYDDLGKKPHLLDGQDVHVALGHQLPGRLQPKDPLAEHVGPVLDAFFDHLEATQVVSQSFEIRRALAGTLHEFKETVRTGQNAHVHGHHHVPQKPFVHGATKLSRNDPCSCGSGKKFKKCHGKNA